MLFMLPVEFNKLEKSVSENILSVNKKKRKNAVHVALKINIYYFKMSFNKKVCRFCLQKVSCDLSGKQSILFIIQMNKLDVDVNVSQIFDQK